MTSDLRTALIAAVVGGATGLLGSWLGFVVENKKADAEFAGLALSILAVEAAEQNPAAREIAMRVLEDSLPVEISSQERVAWLDNTPVIFGWSKIIDKDLSREKANPLNLKEMLQAPDK